MLLENFDNGRGGLNLSAAAQMMALACMVYENQEDNAALYLGPESSIKFWLAREGTWVPSFAVVQSGANRWFVVVEGTVAFLQGLAQASPLNALTAPPDLVQEGETLFGLFYWQVYEELYSRVKDIIPITNPATILYLSGHSMGGAVATVAAFEFARAFGPRRVNLLTIGQPRAVAEGYPHPLPNHYYRVVSPGDPVPEYPYAPAYWILDKVARKKFGRAAQKAWAHYGVEDALYADGTVIGNGPSPYPLPEGMIIDAIHEHFLDNYLARILKAAQVQL